ncbi:MAG: energy-coupling factor transporter transmembrane component T [Clostridia bacterium]
MLSDITIGQFIPGNSILHRLDPRSKILGAILFMILLFIVKNFWAYGILALLALILIVISGVPVKYVLKGLRPIITILAFTMVLHFFLTPGKVIWEFWVFKLTMEGLVRGFFMSTRLILLVTVTSMLTLTTSPIALTDGIELLLKPMQKIGVPAHELAMMMSIALRFIPTLLEETERIMKAQQARGADFETGSLVKRAKSLVPLLVPLFVGAFRRADELAVAMEARCYRGGVGRTRMKKLEWQIVDTIAVSLVVALMGLSIFERIFL